MFSNSRFLINSFYENKNQKGIISKNIENYKSILQSDTYFPIKQYIFYKLGNTTFNDKKESFSIQTNKNEGEWLVEMLQKISVAKTKTYTFQEIKADFETSFEDFELFWYSKPVNTLREFGLLVL